MLVAAVFIIFLGASGVGRTYAYAKEIEDKETAYNNTLKVVQKEGTLRLLGYSTEIGKRVAKCLISKFNAKTDTGAHRSLETNVKFNETRGDNRTYSQSTTNITIILSSEQHITHLRILDDEGQIPYEWTYTVDVLYAMPDCFILHLPSKHGGKHSCIHWGSEEENKCSQIFNTRCTSPMEVDHTKCNEIKK